MLILGIGFIIVSIIGLLVAFFGFLRPIVQGHEPSGKTGKIIASVIIAVFSVGFIVAGIINLTNL